MSLKVNTKLVLRRCIKDGIKKGLDSVSKLELDDEEHVLPQCIEEGIINEINFWFRFSEDDENEWFT